MDLLNFRAGGRRDLFYNLGNLIRGSWFENEYIFSRNQNVKLSIQPKDTLLDKDKRIVYQTN